MDDSSKVAVLNQQISEEILLVQRIANIAFSPITYHPVTVTASGVGAAPVAITAC